VSPGAPESGLRRQFRLALLVVCAAGILPAQQVVAPPPLHLAAGDRIQIRVFQTPELNTTTQLGATGAIVMPAAGRVRLSGLTIAQAQRAIARRLRASGYLLAPQVTVLVKRYAGLPVTVLGAVRAPGLYWVRSDWGLLAILARAGGLEAGAGEEVLIRQPAEGKQSARTVAVSLNGPGGAAADIAVRPRAVVQVVAPGQLYIGGAVKRPGEFPFPATGLTLLEAVSLAGGAAMGAGSGRTWIVSSLPDGRRIRRIVNLGAVESGRAPDPSLEPFDLVYVPMNTGKKTLIRGLEMAVATGAAIVTGLIVFRR
jgi:polysaccharide export outer membrane protein